MRARKEKKIRRLILLDKDVDDFLRQVIHRPDPNKGRTYRQFASRYIQALINQDAASGGKLLLEVLEEKRKRERNEIKSNITVRDIIKTPR